MIGATIDDIDLHSGHLVGGPQRCRRIIGVAVADDQHVTRIESGGLIEGEVQRRRAGWRRQRLPGHVLGDGRKCDDADRGRDVF